MWRQLISPLCSSVRCDHPTCVSSSPSLLDQEAGRAVLLQLFTNWPLNGCHARGAVLQASTGWGGLHLVLTLLDAWLPSPARAVLMLRVLSCRAPCRRTLLPWPWSLTHLPVLRSLPLPPWLPAWHTQPLQEPAACPLAKWRPSGCRSVRRAAQAALGLLSQAAAGRTL